MRRSFVFGTALFLALVSLGALGCAKHEEPTASAPPPVAPPAAAKPAQASGDAAKGSAAAAGPKEVVWDTPSAWLRADNPSPMRKATYKVAKAEGDPEDAELAVSQAGGGVDANVERWSKQFEKGASDTTRREERKVGELKVTIVELTGTFASGMPGADTTPKTDWAMLGAIIETQPQTTFFKLTGPKKTVMAAKADFDKLVASLRAK
jgi:hypothetical protein